MLFVAGRASGPVKGDDWPCWALNQAVRTSTCSRSIRGTINLPFFSCHEYPCIFWNPRPWRRRIVSRRSKRFCKKCESPFNEGDGGDSICRCIIKSARLESARCEHHGFMRLHVPQPCPKRKQLFSLNWLTIALTFDQHDNARSVQYRELCDSNS
jgi:hypothetical protein